VIDTDQKLAELLPNLQAADWISLDTEADSLHAYPEKLCLLQISIPKEDVLIDPLASLNLQPLREVLAKHELILHGGDYDLRLLRKNLQFVPRAVFDTMIASRLIGCREFGLIHLVERFLGVRLEKGPQKANWARRPLTPRMEAYARSDTHYLNPLAAILTEQLIQKGRLAWLQESCARLIAECAVARTLDPDAIWRVKGSQKLPPHALAVLREIWHWREQEATVNNKPPYFIMTPADMVGLAEAAAGNKSWKALVPSRFSQRRRHGLVEAIGRGLEAEPPKPPPRRSTPRQTEQERQRQHRLEQRRDRQAAELGIDPTLIANRLTLALLAKNWTVHSAELMSWQRELLAPE
jgi:ribonuclease D